MSKKCNFRVGDRVWILPFEEVAGRHRLVCWGIPKEAWENERKKCSPVTIGRLSDDGAANMIEIGYYWPLKALVLDDPESVQSVPIDDLI